jgi:translation initiation factor IF-2
MNSSFKKYNTNCLNSSYIALKDRYSLLSVSDVLKKNSSKLNDNSLTTINFIYKASTLSMLESLKKCVGSVLIKNKFLSIRFISLREELGLPNKNDLFLASSLKDTTIILSFFNKKSKLVLNSSKLFLIEHSVIYKINTELDLLLIKLVEKSNSVFNSSGEAEVIKIFKMNRSFQLLGCRPISGFFEDGRQINIFRKDQLLCNDVTVQGIEHQNSKVSTTRKINGNFCIKILNKNVCVGDLIKCF